MGIAEYHQFGLGSPPLHPPHRHQPICHHIATRHRPLAASHPHISEQPWRFSLPHITAYTTTASKQVLSNPTILLSEGRYSLESMFPLRPSLIPSQRTSTRKQLGNTLSDWLRLVFKASQPKDQMARLSTCHTRNATLLPAQRGRLSMMQVSVGCL